MSETSTTPSPQTQLFSDAAMQNVTIEKSGREPPTPPAIESPRFPVRVRDRVRYREADVIELANAAGSEDNITVLVVELG